jgi:hypothetical protein
MVDWFGEGGEEARPGAYERWPKAFRQGGIGFGVSWSGAVQGSRNRYYLVSLSPQLGRKMGQWDRFLMELLLSPGPHSPNYTRTTSLDPYFLAEPVRTFSAQHRRKSRYVRMLPVQALRIGQSV